VTVLAESIQVTKRFGALVAVDRVSVQVAAGEVVGLLGANGAGKTTLIRLLLGLVRPSGGEARLFGKPPSRATRRRLGYVPQGLGLYQDLTPLENLAFARSVFAARTDSVPALLPASLRAFADVPVGALPLGVQRRVAFAGALAHHPELLVLDEPTSGVDPLARARLWETIREAAEGGVGVLVTTHHMEEAQECDRLVVMASGMVVAEGTVEEIIGDAWVVVVESSQWARAFAALERSGMTAALVGRTLRVPAASAREVERALGAVAVAAQVTEAPATLEERFLELTRSAGASRPAPEAAG
jgi:ABC-2 type transport system ATP-binding protein/ribosome-dependent ATPase